MKNTKNIFLLGAALLGLAACQPEAKQPTEAEIDTLVEQKVNEVKANLQQECDKSILAAATAKADSIMVAAANKPRVIERVVQAPAPKPKKTVVTKKKEDTPPPPPPPPNQGKKNNAAGKNLGKKGNTNTQSGKAAPQGENLGKKR